MWWRNRREIDALRREITELQLRQGPSPGDVEALRTQVEQLEKNPVVTAASAVERLETRMPEWLRKPMRWVYVLSVVGALSAVTAALTLLLLSRQADTLDRQTELMKQQTETLDRQAKTMELQTDTLQKQAQTMIQQTETLDQQAKAMDQQTVAIEKQTTFFEDQTAAIRSQANLLKEQLDQQQRAHTDQMREQQDALEEAKAQRRLTQQQIENQEEATRKQQEDTLTVRRTQLLTLIYEEEDCGDLAEELKAWEERKAAAWKTEEFISEPKPRCSPRAPLRLRQEAVLALAKLDGQELDLREADLREADLRGADLREADLREADLSRANFLGADLTGANLSGARLLEANLEGATISGANLSRANLSGANLKMADLRAADTLFANVSGALLPGTQGYGFYSHLYIKAMGDHTTMFHSIDSGYSWTMDRWGRKRPETWRKEGEDWVAWKVRLHTLCEKGSATSFWGSSYEDLEQCRHAVNNIDPFLWTPEVGPGLWF